MDSSSEPKKWNKPRHSRGEVERKKSCRERRNVRQYHHRSARKRAWRLHTSLSSYQRQSLIHFRGVWEKLQSREPARCGARTRVTRCMRSVVRLALRHVAPTGPMAFGRITSSAPWQGDDTGGNKRQMLQGWDAPTLARWFQDDAGPRSNFAIRRQDDPTDFTGCGKIINRQRAHPPCNEATYNKADVCSCKTQAEVHMRNLRSCDTGPR